MIYMQGRFQLPVWGRFASPDPAMDQHPEQPQSWNLNSYVQNNPTMMTDPTGMVGLTEEEQKAFDEQKRKEDADAAARQAKFAQAQVDRPPAQRQTSKTSDGQNIVGAPASPDPKQLASEALGRIAAEVPRDFSIAKELEKYEFMIGGGLAAVGKEAAVALGTNPSSQPKMQMEVERSQAPKTVDRVDKGRGPFEKDHIHFGRGEKSSALNNDGTWKHKPQSLTNAVKNWLVSHSWILPK